jgi:hypothetical protein
MASMVDRMMRAARLDAGVYEEVESDPTAMGQATMTVVLASVAGGIGTYSETGFAGLIGGTIGSLIGWYVWAFLTYYIGTRWLPEPTTQADTGQMLRVLGFASSPGVLRAAGFLPVIGTLALIVAPIWMLVATVVAVRQALDYTSTGRAIGVCIVGFFVQLAVIVLILLFAMAFAGTAGSSPTA